MSIFSKLFGHKDNEEQKIGGMEDYMTLIRVYFQAAIAERVGITNLNALPDLRQFKTSLHIPTVNNKLGIGEKSHCKKMLRDIYGTEDYFFKEIDQSIRKGCSKMQDVQVYLLQFQNFTQSHDAYRQLDEIQIETSFYIQEGIIFYDGKNHFRHLQQEQLHGPKRTESGC